MTTVITVEQLKKIGDRASEVVQTNAEVIGVLKTVEAALIERSAGLDDSNEVWAIRSAYRSLQSSVNEAFEITEDIEAHTRKEQHCTTK